MIAFDTLSMIFDPYLFFFPREFVAVVVAPGGVARRTAWRDDTGLWASVPRGITVGVLG